MHNIIKDQKATKNAFSSYAQSCLRHASRDYFKKALRYNSHTTLLDENELHDISPSLNIYLSSSIRVENRATFLQIIDELKFNAVEKKVLVLKYCKDQTDKEIANNLGISRQAVSKMKANLLRKLKEHLCLYC
ncbi:sigma-70 family RNA polymerase sigma factor [Paenibacillus sp. FSL R7-0048]|uniref:sigma-70 family RNA polymerase sigma factor n=1 Tax=Paenibacillus TaxID=44249 RepID=UPI00096EA4F8|nr:sigma-70 family RNA polymerase sigma factor [Paenibacillus odorifer]OMD64132.1 hypothetical protein BSK48_25385 [Paenibacillus odorifer]